MYVHSYKQLVTNCKTTKCCHSQQAAVINNLRSERQWLEEDNQIQREELEKSQKTLKDLETLRKLRDNKLKKKLQRLKESHRDIMWKHKIKNTVWERGKRKKSQAEGSLHFAVKGA